MRHEKKVWPEYFQAILDGKKNFELRLADRKCEEGDTLVLQERDPTTKNYTGRTIEKEVTYVRRTKDFSFFSPENIEKYGYQIIAFK
jgi:ASC-1-like (ASCH) protein